MAILKHARKHGNSKSYSLTLSPLALLLLAACGGGGGGGPVSFTRDGKVIKGPLEGAKAFLDYDGDGEHDSNEPMVRTDSDGSYTLTGSSTFSNATLVAIADEQTVDTSSGVVLSGITLKAPASAEVVSIASTIYQDAFEAAAEAGGSAPSADDIAALLGIDTAALPDGKDIFSFNPYDDPTSAASKSVEAASQQIAAVLTSIAAVADATGGDAVDSSKAFEAALSSVTKVFTDSIGSVDTSNSAAVATFLADTVVAQAVTEVKSTVETAVNDYYQAQVDAGTITADQKQAAVVKSAKSFDAVEDTVVTSVKAVTAAIKTAVDSGLSLSDSSVKDVFSVTSSLTSQITTAATESAAKVNELIDNAIARGTAVADLATNDALEAEITGATAAINNNAVTIKDAASVATVAANKAPTDISLTNADSENTIQFSEGAASLVIGSLTTTDTETLDQTKFKYTIGGDDALDANGNAQFAISSDGVLSFVSKPDYETKSEYSIAIKSEDEAGKSRSEVYTIKITDVDENAFDAGFQVTTDSATGADAALTDYIYASQTGQVQADEVSIDLGSAGSALTFAAITLDLNNINNGLSSSAAHQSSVVGIPIQKVPVIKGSTQEQKITVKLTEGSDGARASGEREIELSFDVVLTGSGSNFAITPKAVDGSYIVDISYINSSDTEYPAVEMTATSNNTLSYSGGVLSVQLFDLLTQIPESIVPNSVLGSGGTFYATISGLPFLDEDGTSLSTIEGQIVIEDRNAPPALQGPDAGSVTEDASPFVLGTLEASDIEQDVITYGVKGASGTVTELLGSYGTLTVNSSTGSYRYELDNANSVVNALDVGGVLTETFTVVATATGGSTEKLLSVTINGANDQPGAISLSADTITENELGAVVGTLSAVDPEGNTLTYTLTNFGNGAEFEIVSGNQLKLRDDIAADYDVTGGEQKTVKITVKDGDGRTPVETELNININNINEQHTFVAPAVNLVKSISEDGLRAKIEGKITVNDPEDASLLYAINGSVLNADKSTQTATIHTVAGVYGDLHFNVNTGSYTYELDNSRSAVNSLSDQDSVIETFAITVADQSLNSQLSVVDLTGELKITVSGNNDAPNTITLSGLSVLENLAGLNAEIGTLSAADPEAHAVTFEVDQTVGDYSNFQISNGKLYLANGFAADFETDTDKSLSVRVIATDSLGKSAYQDFSIEIRDQNVETTHFVVSDDDTVDATFIDHLNGEQSQTTTSVNLTENNGTLRFSDIEIDQNNLMLAATGSSEFNAPNLTLTFDQVPTTLGTLPVNVTIGVWDVIQESGPSSSRELGERKASVSFDLYYSGDGSTATIQAKDGEIATIEYFSANASTPLTLDVTNGDLDVISFKPGVATGPSTLSIKALNLIQKLSSLAPTSLLSDGGTFYLRMDGLPISTQSNAVTSVEGVVNIKDLVAPSTQVQNVSYSSLENKINLNGLNFDQLGAVVGSDISALIDLSKLTWKVNGDSTIEFADINSAISSAILKSSQKIEITLSTEGAAAIEGASGFGTTGGSDTLVTSAGLLRDLAGNLSTDILKTHQVAMLDEKVKISTDVIGDSSVTDFIGGAESGSVSNLEISETGSTLQIGNVSLDLHNIRNATANKTLFKAPTIDFTVDQLATVSSDTTYPIKITILDDVDGNGAKDSGERKIVIEFDVVLKANSGSIVSGTNADLYIYGRNDVDTVKSLPDLQINNLDSDTLTLTSGGNGLPSSLSIKALNLIEKIESLSPSAVLSDGGTFKISVEGLPLATENSVIDTVEGKLIITDLIEHIGVTTDGARDVVLTDYLNGLIEDEQIINVSNDGGVLKVSNTTLDLENIENALNGSGFKSPSIDFKLDSLPVVNGAKTETVKLSLIDVNDATPESRSTSSSERQIDVEFDLNWQSDGSTLTVQAAAGGKANISYYTSSSLEPIEIVIENSDLDVLSVTTNSTSSTPETLSVKVLSLVQKLNELSPTSILDNGGTFFFSITGAPIKDETSDVTAVQGQFTILDKTPPTPTYSSIEYDDDGTSGTIKLIGSNFLSIGDAGADVAGQLNWTKLTWNFDNADALQLNGNTGPNAHVSSALISTDGLISISLTSTGRDYLLGQPKFGANGAADYVDIQTGFSIDATGNVATSDSASSLSVAYADSASPQLVNFTSNPSSGAFTTGEKIEIIATFDEYVTNTASIVATFDTGKTVPLTAAATGLTKTLTGTYEVSNGETTLDLDVASFTVNAGSSDLFGNPISAITLGNMGAEQSLKFTSDITVDTAPPVVSISTIEFNANLKQITITGDGFTKADLNVESGGDVKSLIIDNKILWKIDNDAAKAVAINTDSILTAKTSLDGSALVITLTDDFFDTLVQTADFAEGAIGAGVKDAIVVSQGFIKDTAGNISTSAEQQKTISSYGDSDPPKLEKFDTSESSPDGAYKADTTVTLTATFDEYIRPGTQITAKLNTTDASGVNDEVVFAAPASGLTKTLTVDWQVPTGRTTTSLDIESFTVNTGGGDVYGNTLSGTNSFGPNVSLADNSSIQIDTEAPTSTVSLASFSLSGVNGQITLSGQNMNKVQLGVDAGVDVKDKGVIDFTQISFSFDGGSDKDLTLAAADVESAVFASNGNSLAITLTENATLNLLSQPNFGATGVTVVADTLSIAAPTSTESFLKDVAGNLGVATLSASTIDYSSDGSGPQLVKFDSSADLTLKSQDTVVITATFDEYLRPGSEISVTFDTEDSSGSKETLILSSPSSGLSKTMSGTYTVQNTVQTDSLNVDSYEILSGDFATDLFSETNTVQVFSELAKTNTKSLAFNSDIKIDTLAPTSAITEISYNGELGVITITGSNFTAAQFGLSDGDTNVLSSVNWDHIVWDINGNNDDTANVSFAASDFSSAVITSTTVITATLTSEKNSALLTTTGFGKAGGDDKLDIIDPDNITEGGLFKDAVGNVSTTDAQNNLAIAYADATGPSQPQFSALDVSGAVITSGSFKEGSPLTLTATFTKANGDPDLIQPGTTFSANLDITANGNPVSVTFYAADTPSNVMSSTYGANKFTVPADVSTTSLEITSYNANDVTDLYGNTLTSSDSIDNKNKLSETSSITIDTQAPTSTVTGVQLNVAANELKLFGTNFTKAQLDATEEVQGSNKFDQVADRINWDNIIWDIDADSEFAATSSDYVFSASDVAKATITDASTITVTLADGKAAELQGKLNFGAAGGADAVDIIDSASDGLFVDAAGNVSTQGTNTTDTTSLYSDSSGPTLQGEGAGLSGTAGNYKAYNATDDNSVTLTATFNELMKPGTEFKANLNTNEIVTFKLDSTAASKILTANYKVGDSNNELVSGKSFADASQLSIESFVTGSATVHDIYGNSTNLVNVPSGKNIDDLVTISIDTTAPTSTITSVSLDPEAGEITLGGSNFTTAILGVGAGANAANAIDFSKLVWDINGDESFATHSLSTNKTFTLDDFSSVTVKDSDEIVLTLKDTSLSALKATSNFGAEGGADKLLVGQGVFLDLAGNTSGAASSSVAISYTDQKAPTVLGLTTTATGNYGAGREFDVVLTMSELLQPGTYVDVTFSSGADPVRFSASATDHLTTMTGKYSVGAGETTNNTPLKVTSISQGTLTDIYGNVFAGSSDTLALYDNLTDAKQEQSILIDTQAPTADITGVTYNDQTGVLIIEGTGFVQTGVPLAGDLLSSQYSVLDWTAFTWNIVGSDKTADFTLSSSKLSSAVLTSDTKITLTLTSQAKGDLYTLADFGADGGQDNIDVAKEFFSDTGGNKQSTVFDNVAITYTDATAPTFVKFDTTDATSDGTYGANQTVYLEATLSEDVQAGSSFVATFSNGDTATFTTDVVSSKMTAGLKITKGSSNDLKVETISSVSTFDVHAGKTLDTALPSGDNLSDNAAIIVDTTAPTASFSSANYNASNGTITLKGENLNTLGVSNNSTVALSQFNWNNLYWDLEGDTVTTKLAEQFEAADIDQVTLVNSATLSVKLKSAKMDELKADSSFAEQGSADKLVIQAGFVKDTAGNAASSDALNSAITYPVAVAPKISEIAVVTGSAGSYSTSSDTLAGKGDPLVIRLKLSEEVQSGARFDLKLNTNDTVTFSASETTDELTSIYIVGAGDDVAKLGVSTVSVSGAESIYGKSMATADIPANQSIGQLNSIGVDTIPVFNNGTAKVTKAGSDLAVNDKLVFNFTEAVSTTSKNAIEAIFETSSANSYSGDTSANWSSDGKQLEVVIQSVPTLDLNNTISFSNVTDLAGNENETITYTFEIL